MVREDANRLDNMRGNCLVIKWCRVLFQNDHKRLIDEFCECFLSFGTGSQDTILLP